MPLAVCVAVLLVKRVDWSPGLLATAALMLLLCLVRGLKTSRSRTTWGRYTAWSGVAGVWVAWACMTAAWYRATHCDRSPALQPERPVACLGDSLTAFGYPRRLQKLVSIPVVDLGRDGISTDDAIKLLTSLTEANPQVVVIELGGHDYLKGRSRAATKENLETIIDACQAMGAEVVLMEIPRGFITDPFSALERQIARERGLELIPDTAIRELVLWSPFAPPGMWLRPDRQLSDDGLHPNARGNESLAEYVAEALTRLYGSEVLAAPRRFNETTK